jgi:2'-5' RNA ligase
VAAVGRLFLAVDLPDTVRDLLAGVLRRWNEGRPLPGRPAPPENWHLTLRFLGDADDVGRDRLLAALDEADRGTRFRVTLGGLGAFPNPRRATVLWIGVPEGAGGLERLAVVAEDAAVTAGWAPEERPFHPHLTVSRIRPDQDVRPLLVRPQPDPVRFEADAITVFRSHLGGGPARYEALERFPLGA